MNGVLRRVLFSFVLLFSLGNLLSFECGAPEYCEPREFNKV